MIDPFLLDPVEVDAISAPTFPDSCETGAFGPCGPAV
jgi:hypothetical protein